MMMVRKEDKDVAAEVKTLVDVEIEERARKEEKAPGHRHRSQ